MTTTSKRNEWQRRYRLRLYARGLTADRKPVRYPKISAAKRGMGHGAECPCYDCLWGAGSKAAVVR